MKRLVCRYPQPGSGDAAGLAISGALALAWIGLCVFAGARLIGDELPALLPPAAQFTDAAQRAVMHLEMGDRHCAAQQFEQAVQEYSRAIELKPNFAEAYNNRAYATVRKNDGAGDPLADLNRALVLRPEFPHAYNTRGCVHLAQGNVNQAIADFTRAIELKGDYPRAYRNRGNALLRKGEVRLAWADFERAGQRPKRVLFWLAGIVLLIVGLTVAAALSLRRSRAEYAE